MISLELDHIGVAVKDLDESSDRYQKLLGTTIVHDEEVPSQRVKVRFLQHGDQIIELLKAMDEESTIAKFIAKRGEGIHHIAYKSSDIHVEMKRLRAEGFSIIQDEPVKGANNKWIFFIHPSSIGGTLIEICQPITN